MKMTIGNITRIRLITPKLEGDCSYDENSTEERCEGCNGQACKDFSMGQLVISTYGDLDHEVHVINLNFRDPFGTGISYEIDGQNTVLNKYEVD